MWLEMFRPQAIDYWRYECPRELLNTMYKEYVVYGQKLQIRNYLRAQLNAEFRIIELVLAQKN